MVCCRPKRAEVATDKAGVCTILLDVPPQSPPPANCSPYLQGNLNSNICIKEHLCYKIKDRSRLLKTGKTRKSILRQASDSLDCIKTNNVWEKKHLTKKKQEWVEHDLQLYIVRSTDMGSRLQGNPHSRISKQPESTTFFGALYNGMRLAHQLTALTFPLLHYWKSLFKLLCCKTGAVVVNSAPKLSKCIILLWCV